MLILTPWEWLQRATARCRKVFQQPDQNCTDTTPVI